MQDQAVRDGKKARERSEDERARAQRPVRQTLVLRMQDQDRGDEGQDADHAPISIAEEGVAEKANVDAGEEGAEDQGQNADVVDAQPQGGDGRRVVHQCVVERGEGQAGRERE